MDLSTLQEVLGISAGILIFFSYIFYIISILRKKTKPNRATWLMLSAISLLIAYSYHDLGAGNTLWAAVGSVAGTVTVALLSLHYGTKQWRWFELVCILIIGISLFAYSSVHNPLLILLLALIMDGCALIPTMYHAYEKPHEEDKLAWTLTFVADIIAILSIETWTFNIALYPLYMVLINGLVVYLIYTTTTIRSKTISNYSRFSRFILSRSK